MARWLTDTTARKIERDGWITDPWEPDEERAVFVKTLGTYAPMWRTEEEVEEVRVVRRREEWTDSRADGIVLAAISSTQPGTLYARCHPLPPYTVRAAVLRLWGAGRIVRVGKGRYRLA